MTSLPTITTPSAKHLQVQLKQGSNEITNIVSSTELLNVETNRTEHDPLTTSSTLDRSAKTTEYTGGHTGASSRTHKYIFSIWYASRYGRLERVQALLDRKTPVDALDTNNQNCTALHWACKFGHLPVAQLLIKHGARTNTIDTDGNSPLHLAAGTGGSLPLIRFLLENASEVRLLNREGHTPAKVARLADKIKFATLIERWQPCGGFTNLRNATFNFQRASEESLMFTLPPKKKEAPPLKPIKWVTPTEATNALHKAHIKRQLVTQGEGLRIKEHRLGSYHPSIAVTLQRMSVLLRELGTSRRQEAIEMLLRCRSIFDSNLQALESIQRNIDKQNMPTLKLPTVVQEATQEQGKEEDNNPAMVSLEPPEPLKPLEPMAPPLDEPLVEAAMAPPVKEPPIDARTARDPRTKALLIPLGSDLPSTIRLRREQLCDVLELLAELYCANALFEESKTVLERAVQALRCVETTVSTMSSSSLLNAHVIYSTVPPLRWATTLTNLGLIERQLNNEEQARKYLLQALTHVEQHIGTGDHAAEILEHIAVGYVAEGNRIKSTVLRERIIQLVSTSLGPQSLALAVAHENLGEDYYALKNFSKSEQQFQSGLVLREHLGQLAASAGGAKPTAGNESGSGNDSGVEGPEIVMAEELIPTNIGHTVESVIEKLEQKEMKRRGSGTNLLQMIHLEQEEGHGERKRGEDAVDSQPLLSGPKILMGEDIQRSYRNVATAGISSVKKNKGIRRVQARILKKKRARAKRLIVQDDIKYVKERAQRHAEGLVKLTGLRV